MGRMLGAYDSDELDRPDLNKCPDCGCYFATEACPLCGRVCPEDMRAGNRAAVKKKRKRTNSSGRVQFIPWYYSWWFILIAMWLFPLVGIVLFITSPYARKWKIIICSVAAVYFVVVQLGLGSYVLGKVFADAPVNDKLSREEYMEACQVMDAEAFYRLADNEDEYVCLNLVIKERLVDFYDDSEYNVYYLCASPDDGVTLLVRDCRVDGGERLLPGDNILVYGEGGGTVTICPEYGVEYYDPCLHMAYAERISD